MNKKKQVNHTTNKIKQTRGYLPEVIVGIMIFVAFFSILLILLN